MKRLGLNQFHIRLLLTQSMLVLVVLIMFTAVVTVKFTIVAKENAYEAISNQRDTLKSQIDLNLGRVEAVIGQLANNDIQLALEKGSFDTQVQFVIENTPMITQVFLIDREGMQFYKSSYQDTLGSRSDRDYFRMAIAGKPNYSSVIISRSTNKPIVVYAIPIYKDNQIIGVLGASIDLAFLSSLVTPRDYNENRLIAYGFIVDRNGSVIAHPNTTYVKDMKNLSSLSPVQSALEGLRGTGAYNFDNQDKLVAYDLMTPQNWGILVQTPKKIALANLTSFQVVMMIAFLLIASISILMATGVSLYFKRPIVEIVNLIKTFETQRICPMQCSLRNDEFGLIGDAFISMANTVLSDQQELENHVEERTQELTVAMDLLLETQSELEMSNHELGNTIQELNQAQEKIIQTEKMAALGRMTTNFAHEVNTPLGTALTVVDLSERTMSELLAYSKNETALHDEVTEHLVDLKDMTDIIRKQLVTMNGLFETMIKSDFVGAFMNETNDNSLSRYLEVQLLDLQSILMGTKHQLNFKSEVSETIDIPYKEKLIQVLKILVQNSRQHGFEGMDEGEINIYLEEAEGGVKLTYSDNGKNLPEEELQKIFEPYYKGSMASGGKGLGLTIVYTLVVSFLNGTITGHNLSPSGLAYVIEIPSIMNMKKGGDTI